MKWANYANVLHAKKALIQASVKLFKFIRSFESHEAKAVASIGFRAVVANDLPNGLKKGQLLKLSGRSEFEFLDGAISKITDIS